MANPFNVQTVYGQEDDAPLPIREWHGGQDQRGKPRAAGYVERTSHPPGYKMYGYRYSYRTATPLTRPPWIHRHWQGTEYLGEVNPDSFRRFEKAQSIIQDFDREVNGGATK